MAFGYAGLAMLVVQFLLTARVRRVTAPFGIDLVYYFHRYLAVFGLLVVLLHYAILKVANPDALGPLDWRTAPPHMTAGRLALLLFLAAVLLSLLRRQLRLEYDRWRLAHALLTTAGCCPGFVPRAGIRALSGQPPEVVTLGFGQEATWVVLLDALYSLRARLFTAEPDEIPQRNGMEIVNAYIPRRRPCRLRSYSLPAETGA